MQVGSLVECIDDNFNHCNSNAFNMPKKGELYFIIGFKEWPRGLGVYLFEYGQTLIRIQHNNGRTTIEQPPFNIKRFAEILPPVEIKQQIENFITF